MQIIKIFDVIKGQRTLQLLEGVKLSRGKIVRYLKGTAYLWDASVLKKHVAPDSATCKMIDPDNLFRELFNGIEHPIICHNMTCLLESAAVVKSMYKMNTEFSVIAAETVYGNVIVLDIMCLPDDLIDSIQPDTFNYSQIVKKDNHE